MNEPLFIIVDLFCGAGGTTTGFVQAELEGSGIAKVIACVNHDPKAIKSHWANHPEVKHFEEDIRTLDLTELTALTRQYQTMYPDAYLILWASLECTNFSKAKGGQPRDADSRTLADHLPRYRAALNPDYIMIENVVEFMSWGPLDANGKPVSRKNGQDWMRWREVMKGEIFPNSKDWWYVDEWKELNSANYGAYTSRNRLFGIFAKPVLPIAWPEPTHAKNPSKFSLHGDLQRWKAVKEVLDFSDEGESIFTRAKPLSDKTLERIYAGLLKYVAKGDTSFISKYYSGKPAGKVNSVNQPSATVTTFGNSSLVQAVGFTAQSVDQPAGTITTVDHHSLVKAAFIQQRNSGEPESKLVDIDGPARTLTATGGNQELVQTRFLKHYYSNGGELSSIESPSATISTRDRSAVVSVTNHNNQSIEQPAGTIMTNDKHSVVNCEPFIMPTNYDNKPVSTDQPAPTITANRKHHYLINPAYGGHAITTEGPCPVIVARQDKVPLYLVQAEEGLVAVPIYPGDSEIMIKIKEFMAIFNIADIKMRMFRIHELLRIQGFPLGYKLEGSQEDQKKFVGNSVVPLVVKKWTEALASRLIETYNQKIA
ncbi:DNA cytosine methyltransferase [Niastella caeni]|uniref:DNA (cytosine-5-)-methyltransferase n=1 Tax=Niastella caeni TaxID=2569763 RepID=A0A4V4GZV9_9BACT|nr:DNA cytosine methyltransferase [Niastella caeni]THU34226.1 DNA cytosine methyltransferase [Niastella caeni]